MAEDKGNRSNQHAAIRRTRPLFVLYLTVIALGIVAAIVVGLARRGDDAQAGAAVERFSAAIRSDDGKAACELLSPQTRTALEEQEGSKCESAILELGLSGGAVGRVEVAEKTATAQVTDDGNVFLDEEPDGWRITALGCKPLPDRPYDCEVES